jgi:RNA polymerase sigma-70 factor, ECF subfamily
MSHSSQSIQPFLIAARAGSRADMERLAVAIREQLYPFVLRTTCNCDLTEDILQETLLAVVQKLGSLRDTRKFWPWVYRIAWNEIRDSVRLSRLHASAKASLLCNRSQDGHTDHGNLLEAKIHAETLQQLSALLEELSREHRDVLALRCYEQLPYTEIASLTRTTPQKARARFHRATQSLRAKLLVAD